MEWGTCLFFSTAIQQIAGWMDMYWLTFEWQENIVISLSCSDYQFVKFKAEILIYPPLRCPLMDVTSLSS